MTSRRLQAAITFVNKATNAVVNIGRDLNDFDALHAWVEGGTDPGDLVAADPSDPSARIVAKGAHQLGLQDFPKRYFEQADGLAANTNGPRRGAEATQTITGEGISRVSYFAQDALYNDETDQTFVVQVDRTAPTVAATGNAGAYTVDQTVEIRAARP